MNWLMAATFCEDTKNIFPLETHMLSLIKRLFQRVGAAIMQPIKTAARNRAFLAGEWIPMRTGGRVFQVKKDVQQGDTYLLYKCPDCGTQLTDGPCGGAAVNAVCDKCRINFGCLPGYDFPINLGIFDDKQD